MNAVLPPDFAVTGLRDDTGGAVVAFRGEFDLATVREAAATITTTLDASPEVLLLDLRDLEFIDSSGIRVLLQARDRCLRSGIALFLVRGSRAVMRAIDQCGLIPHFGIVDDLAPLRDPHAFRAMAAPGAMQQQTAV